ncbi:MULTISPECIES: hypothetical protein [unclassified Mesorhizobium]|nr:MULTISPECIES: hypothetical protein [unclassified Mesorhizobium]ESZ18056.1 hypothetical protein X737_20740 [Mesorhizobium sp. L48C026A00]
MFRSPIMGILADLDQTVALWETYDAAPTALFAATQTGEPAPRYQAA